MNAWEIKAKASANQHAGYTRLYLLPRDIYVVSIGSALVEKIYIKGKGQRDFRSSETKKIPQIGSQVGTEQGDANLSRQKGQTKLRAKVRCEKHKYGQANNMAKTSISW